MTTYEMTAIREVSRVRGAMAAVIGILESYGSITQESLRTKLPEMEDYSDTEISIALANIDCAFDADGVLTIRR